VLNKKEIDLDLSDLEIIDGIDFSTFEDPKEN